jgi:uncharacterized protein (TIGR00369 family)
MTRLSQSKREIMSTSSNTSLTRADIIRQFLPTSPYVGHLGIRLVDMQPDMAILTLPFTDSLITIGTTVHGGAIASLIDTAAMVAVWSDTTVPDNLRGTTVTYLAPAEQEDIQATARVLQRGRSLVYLDVEVQGVSGKRIAKGLVTYCFAQSLSTAFAALCPGPPITPPPGCTPEPHRYSPSIGVR